MCEVFGVTANKKVQLNNYLNQFFSHSNENPSGWGIATFDGKNVSVEKEPVRADKSIYLKSKLRDDVFASNLFGHIRRATIGYDSYINSHPFTAIDDLGRTWTLIHNGTIFEAPELKPYQYAQAGTTDSERILLYIIDRINNQIKDDNASVKEPDNERLYKLIDSIVVELSKDNKLNILLYDGENMYIHKNAEGTLFEKEERDVTFFSTKPLDRGDWSEVEQNRLLVYKNGSHIYSGTKHNHSYVEDPEKMKLLYLAFSGL
ncbi:MAG: class II glutamine amidotransferase [Lachnospiraceae bacterium]|nr:class II glutamine amidotransferase [Lachnospiraceae bacterium]